MSTPESISSDISAAPALRQNPNYRWYLLGGAISLLGDQFTLIALPWLVLAVSHDPLHLGLAIGILNLPRAALILVGGAMVDRHSPKAIMMWSKFASTLLLLALAAAILAGPPTLGTIYLLAFGLGLAGAFSIPAGTSLLPRLIAPSQLQAANGTMLVLRQLSFFVGPIAAGILIAGLGAGGDSAHGLRGFAAAFLLDALTFALSAWTLAKIRPAGVAAQGSSPPSRPGVFASIREGVRYCWSDGDMRVCFAYWAAVALLVMGPIQVGLPVLATTRFHDVASAFGILMGAHGGGTLVGMIVSGARRKATEGRLGTMILSADFIIGLLFIGLGQAQGIGMAVSLLVLIGIVSGYMQVAVFTWIQSRAPASKLGRVMSLFMLIFVGLSPISAALAGSMLRVIELPVLFAACGAAVVATVLLGLVLGLRRVTGSAATAATAR